MLRTIAAAALVVDGKVSDLLSLRRDTATLGSPNGVQLLKWNRSADAGISGSIDQLCLEISTATLGRGLPVMVRRACLIVLYSCVSMRVSFSKEHSNMTHRRGGMFHMDWTRSYHICRIGYIACSWSKNVG